LLHDCANRYQNRTCLTSAQSGESLTFREFDIRVNRLAHGLAEQFPDADGYLAIMLENSIDYLALTYALKKINRVEVSVNRAFRGAALQRMINLTQCDSLVTSAAHFDALAQIAGELPHLRNLIVTDAVDNASRLFGHLRIVPFAELLSVKETHIQSAAADTDLAAIMFTSGTTGVSKGCMLSHRFAVRTAENIIEPFRLTADDVNYTPYPLSHIGPAYYDILPGFLTGGSAVLRDGFSLSAFWPEVSRHGVTWFMCLGSVQQLLYAAPPGPLDTDHQVTRCWATPAPVPKADFDKRFGVHLIPGGGYGSTDAGWVVVPQWDHPGGKVLPHFEIAIVDDNDDPLPAGCEGQLLIRPKEPGVMSDGYFGMPDKTMETRRNLWFHTGDIACVDEQGLFYFRCRMAERIRVLGEMINGFEVEEGVLTHPAVQDAAAIGVPADIGEEEIRLFVTLKPDRVITGEELREHCRGVMAKFMVPARITVLDEMPRTPTGKPEKGVLRRLV
jgi:crotonobetaine/carnitine-CoA ligase